MAYLHPQGIYLENKAIFVDSYGNRLKLPDYTGITHFYYSRLITDVKKDKVNVVVFTLSQNYPDPFNPTTTITYSLPKSSLITLKIYDLLGREIETLVNEEKPAGNYEVEFDGSNLPSGIYFYRMQAGKFIKTRKFVLIK